MARADHVTNQPQADGPPPITGLVSRVFAWAVLSLRFLIVPGWVLAAVAATLWLPSVGHVQGTSLTDLVPKNTPALQTEERSLREFGVPLLSRTEVVQRNPAGLSLAVQARALQRALQVDQHRDPELAGVAGALPISNELGLVPGSRERNTTVITYLFFGNDVSLDSANDLAHRYAKEVKAPGDSLVGVTGPLPARLEQSHLILTALPWVEVATVLVIALIVGLTFRSVGAPVATLFAAAVSYLTAIRVVAWVGQRFGSRCRRSWSRCSWCSCWVWSRTTRSSF